MENSPNALIQLLLLSRDFILTSDCYQDLLIKLDQRGIQTSTYRKHIPHPLKADLHSHTCHSDGLFNYKQILWWAKLLGLEAIGITDHDNVSVELVQAIEEGLRIGCHAIPGLEYTIDQVSEVAIPGLEIGVHFFPIHRFSEFLSSSAGERFCSRFTPMRLAKTNQAMEALANLNRHFLAPLNFEPVSELMLNEYSGNCLPICASTATHPILKLILNSGDEKLMAKFPNTRALWAFFHQNKWIPKMSSGTQTLTDLIEMKKELAGHGINFTLTLNHPEELIAKGNLYNDSGEPDAMRIAKVINSVVNFSPELTLHFIERYTPRTTEVSSAAIDSALKNCNQKLVAVASCDSHTITGDIDALGHVTGWVEGEDFITGIGKITKEFPQGNLRVPKDYYPTQQLLALMEKLSR